MSHVLALDDVLHNEGYDLNIIGDKLVYCSHCGLTDARFSHIEFFNNIEAVVYKCLCGKRFINPVDDIDFENGNDYENKYNGRH